ncbi:MAG: Ig-like domain-containing protein [Candidatus Colwellbacteria bacterium]|nr:Ig-like domain-containing protein [Candidatus Colwellbacteria bacterium]
MKKILLILLSTFYFLLSASHVLAATKTINLFEQIGPPKAKIWLAPSTYNGTLKGPLGPSGLTAKSTWRIAQWGILQELPEQFIDLGQGKWKIENQHARVTFAPSGSGLSVELRQDATNSEFGCGNEFDLLIEPNENRAYRDPPHPQAFVPEGTRPRLGIIDTLTMRVSSRLLEALQGNRCAPGTNFASTVFAVVFHNDTANQGLFYQIVTFDSRNTSFNGFWFDTQGPIFGVSDSVSMLGGSPLLQGGAAIFYNLNIAERVKSLIQNNPHGLDKNLNNWKVFGAYYGSYVSAGSKITSEYKALDISATFTVPTASLTFEPKASAKLPTTIARTWLTTGDEDRQIPYRCTNEFSETLTTSGEDTFTVDEDDLDTGWGLDCVITAQSVSGQQATSTASFIFDDSPPEIDLTSPEEGDTVSGIVTVSADAEDKESGIASVEFFVDDTSIGIDETAPYEMKWDSVKTLVETASLPFFKKLIAFLLAPTVRAGESAVIKAVATNAVGLSATSAAVSVDITCPEVPLPKLPGIPNPCTGPAEYIQYWFYLGLYLAGIAALLAAVAGGTLYMVSATMQNAATGKKLMTNALLGLILLFGSWLLLTTLGGAGLTKLKNPVLPPLPGLEGLPCTTTPDCRSPALQCVNGTCYDGSAGDPCSFVGGGGPLPAPQGTCQAGSECVNGKCVVRPAAIWYCKHGAGTNLGCYDTSNCDGSCRWPLSCETYTGAIADCPYDGKIF